MGPIGWQGCCVAGAIQSDLWGRVDGYGTDLKICFQCCLNSLVTVQQSRGEHNYGASDLIQRAG